MRLALLVLAFAAALPGADTAAIARPTWLAKEPLVIAGNWDSMPIFRLRVGGTPVAQEAEYAREHTEEAVRKLKEIGVTMLVMHYYKGFGLEAEREHMEDARRLAALCRKYGLRVGVYVGSTIGYETFLEEVPQAADWFAPRFLGRPVVYGDQTFRKRVYFMHPGYRDYIKRVLRIAVEDWKVDLVHFDNTSLQAQPPIFFHPLAIEDFRTFLRQKYSPEQLKQRMGISSVRYVEPPESDRPVTQMNDPLWQEWADFRCRQLTAYYAEMRQYIRGLNPETAVESNPHSGISGRNTVWEQGVDYERFLPEMDVVWTEEGNEAGLSSDGILISKIRTFKMATQFGNSVFTYTGGRRGGELAMAESMAFNRQNLGMVGGALAGYELPERQRKYVRFYRDQFDSLYRDVRNRAEVAVLHGFASMAYNNDLPWQSSMLVEQALIQAKVPFDIIFDNHLKDLSKYRVLVLPDQESLSDQQVELIREYVKRGGGMVATDDTSLYTEQRRRRPKPALADLLGGARHTFGQGRTAYIAAVWPAIPKPPGAGMISRYWKLPVNWREVVDAVKWAAGRPMSLEVEAPPTTVAEVTERNDKVMVHLLNYAPAAASATVEVAMPEGRKASRAWLASPDHVRRSLAYEMRNGRARFSVPGVRVYDLAVFELE